LTRREYIICIILHELGHALRHKRFLFNRIEYNEQQRNNYFENGDNPRLFQLLYWNKVEEEKQANNFVKEYFLRYLIKKSMYSPTEK